MVSIPSLKGMGRSVSKAKVLIIDDDVDLLDELTDMLTGGEFEVALRSRAEEASSAAHLSGPDIIPVDMLVSETSGLRVIEQIKADTRTAGIPIIIIGGHCGENEGCNLVRANGLAGIIKEPMNNLEVIAEIERHLA